MGLFSNSLEIDCKPQKKDFICEGKRGFKKAVIIFSKNSRETDYCPKELKFCPKEQNGDISIADELINHMNKNKIE